MDQEYTALIKEYWMLREEISRAEGKLGALQKIIIMLHNYNWRTNFK